MLAAPYGAEEALDHVVAIVRCLGRSEDHAGLPSDLIPDKAEQMHLAAANRGHHCRREHDARIDGTAGQRRENVRIGLQRRETVDFASTPYFSSINTRL